MPMPKGHKHDHGYATIKQFSGGMDYRSIAERMTAGGDKMNHATARNVFLSAMQKIARPVHGIYDQQSSPSALMQTVKDPRFQSGVAEILDSIRRK